MYLYHNFFKVKRIKYMKYLQIMSCLLIVLLFGCNEVNPKGEKEVREFMVNWNKAHSQLKSPYLTDFYMPVVIYYGKERTRQQVQNHKNMLFQEFPNYSQNILNDEMTITKVGGNYLVTFIKQVKYNDVEANYQSFLSVINKNGNFRISREGVDENAENLDAPIFPSSEENRIIISNTRKLYGDFNGDGLSDFATVISPEIKNAINTEAQINQTVECIGECNSVIMFSHKDLKPITVKGAYQSQLENLKDLNGDGADEIGFWDIKPTTKSLHIFNATNGELLTEPIVINTTVHKNLKLVDVFKKTGINKITVTKSALENGKWVLKNEVIKLD